MTNQIFHSILVNAKNELINSFWGISKEDAQSKALAKARKGQKVVTIIDKQFGLAVNSWDGAPRLPKWGRPFITRDGNCITTWALTQKQYTNIMTK